MRLAAIGDNCVDFYEKQGWAYPGRKCGERGCLRATVGYGCGISGLDRHRQFLGI